MACLFQEVTNAVHLQVGIVHNELTREYQVRVTVPQNSAMIPLKLFFQFYLNSLRRRNCIQLITHF